MGPGSMSVMRLIKRALDPKEILNPDKILDIEASLPDAGKP